MTGTNRDKQLSRIILKGFKSIARCDLELSRVNVLIGANGAGKSNFIGFFRMIQQLLEQNLQVFVSRQGSPDALLHFGRKTTQQLEFQLYFGNNGYFATLEPTQDNRLMFAKESFWWDMSGEREIGRGHFETLAFVDTRIGIDEYVLSAMQQWRVYHFHDTSDSAYVKQLHGINDNTYLRADARNLASFLYLLRDRNPASYQKIVKTIRLVAPFFGDFYLRPSPQNKEFIELEWFERGQDVPFKAHLLSDGTLRFVCLATVFLQPEELQPETILVDEPELGLHPYAIAILASLIRTTKKQVIISTQSVELLNEFDANDVIVVDRNEEKSSLRRLVKHDLEEWLEDYSLGELWKERCRRETFTMIRINIFVEGQTEETFNDNPLTAPSKRILNCCHGYDKPLHGSLLAIDIGLDSIRQQCQHFNQWLLRLESILLKTPES